MSTTTADDDLANGLRSFSAGDAARAWRSAHGALAEARARADGHQEAQALVLLARAATLESRFRCAYPLAREASALFERHSDATASADAQLVASYAAAALGMSDISLMTAECARSRLGPGDSLQSAIAANYTGVAAFWQQDFARSASALESALILSSQSFTAPAAFQPLSNLAFCEMLRATSPGSRDERHDKLEMLSRQLERLIVANRTEMLSVACVRVGLLLTRIIRAVAALKRSQQAAVDMHLSAFEREARFLPEQHWLHALPWLVRCVACRLAGDLPSAASAARMMFTRASLAEHAALERLAVEHWTAVAVEVSGSATVHALQPRLSD